jgi:hypothetical protein
MEVRNPFFRARCRSVWTDPVRKLRTLEGFSKTEGDGAHDIASALRHVANAELRAHMQRHAADEAHHAELFRRRAGELRTVAAASPLAPTDPDKLYDLSRGREAEVDSHGFFTAGVLEERGEIAYIAMLHVAERRAAQLFRVHRDLTRDDPETCAIFDEILRDELYHVAYTGTWLRRWRKEGRGREVRAELRRARGSRLLGAWTRLGSRAGAAFGRTLLFVLYESALVPFAFVAKRRFPPGGWHDADAASRESARSQY